jgi:hypothetical protein
MSCRGHMSPMVVGWRGSMGSSIMRRDMVAIIFRKHSVNIQLGRDLVTSYKTNEKA